MANDVEIRVRVANQTAGGLTAVNASMDRLRRSARDANQSVTRLRTSLAGVANLDVDLNDRTDAGIAAIRANIGALRSEGPVRLEAEFRGDAAGITTTAAAMRTLRTNASSANTALTAMTPRALAAAAALEVLQVAAREASNALRTLRGRAAATSVSMQELRTSTTSASNSLRTFSTRAGSADERVDNLSNRSRALTSHMDDLDGSLRRAGGSMAGLRGTVGSTGSSFGNASGGMRKLMMAALALSPALVPIAAAVAPLIPALGAAGVAMGVFGAALLPQILNMKKLGEAQKAHKQALEDSGKTSKAAAETEKDWLKEVAKASPEVRKASASLGVMKDQYRAWTDSLAGDTLPVATKSFAVLGALFPKLTPLVKGTAAEFNRFMNILAVGVQSKGFDDFMVKMSEFSQRTLRSAIDGMVRFGQAMNRGIQGDRFREFLAYVRESGPIVGETLANLGRALMKIIAAAADTGIGILTLVNAFARLVDAVPTDLLSLLMQVAFAMKAVQLAAMAFAVVGPAMLAAAGAVRTFIASAHFAGISMAISGVAASMTALQKASVVLAVIAAVAIGINTLAEKARGAPPDVDRLTVALKELGASANFTGELRKTFGDMDGLVRKIGQIGVESKKAGEAAKGAFGFKIPVLDDIGNWLGTKFTEMNKGQASLRALKDDFKGLDTALSNLATSGHSDLAAESFGKIAAAAQAQGFSLGQVKELLPQYGDAVAALQADQDLAARSMGLFGAQAISVQAKLDLQKQSAEGLRQSINALNEVYLAARGGVRGMEAAIDAATEALKTNGKTLDENTEKGRANNQALDNLAGATMKAVEATLANGQGWAAAQAIWERGREQLLANAEAMGLNENQARALADQILATPDKTAVLRGNMEDLQSKLNSAKMQLASVPDSRKAEVRANIDDLEKQLSRARAALNGLDDRTVYIRTVYQEFRAAHPGGQAQAHGGIIGAAGGGPRSRMTLVGEQGPELVDLAPGSRVRSNPDSKRIADGMAGGGGGGPIAIQLVLEGRQIAEAIFDPLRYEIRTRGGNVQSALGQRGAS
ncbi:hypothetical protein ACODT3_10875 [Streptomyces sp. 4.24]|uniref:hypothetical protein n=1 Tax=Streptomyces tritrimontium TaxID=3406573 RepID=UPI003BB7E089